MTTRKYRTRGGRMRLAAAAAAVTLALTPANLAVADSTPALTEGVDSLRAALRCPPVMKDKSDPVLLVHGATQTGRSAWSWNYDNALQTAGHDSCTVDLPRFGTADMQISAQYLVQAIRDLAARPGDKVDLVTFSSGALVLRWALTWWPDLRAKVDDVILLGAPNQGFTGASLMCSPTCAPAVWQTRPDSAFLTALASAGNDPTPGPASWTNIYSGTDELVFRLGGADPWAAAAELGGASNIRVQRVCPGRLVEHVGHLYDAQVLRLVLDALANAGPADVTRAGAVCGQVTMPGVEAWDAAAQSVATAANFVARTSENKVPAEPAIAPYAK